MKLDHFFTASAFLVGYMLHNHYDVIIPGISTSIITTGFFPYITTSSPFLPHYSILSAVYATAIPSVWSSVSHTHRSVSTRVSYLDSHSTVTVQGPSHSHVSSHLSFCMSTLNRSPNYIRVCQCWHFSPLRWYSLTIDHSSDV